MSRSNAMSNPLIERINILHEEKEEEKAKEEYQTKFKKVQFLRRMSNIFEPEITESFEGTVATANGSYYKYEATLTFDNLPLKIWYQTSGNHVAPLQIFFGTECLQVLHIMIPSIEVIDNIDQTSLLTIQGDNTHKLIRELHNIVHHHLESYKLRKAHFWAYEIPRNYAGAYQVPKLLEDLEIDKVFLMPELYKNTKATLINVLQQKKDNDEKERIEREKNTRIIQEELSRFKSEMTKYDTQLKALELKLGNEFFRVWSVYSITYMSEHIEASMLRDEDGQLIEDLQEAMTFRCHAITPPDMEGFRKIVDMYGNITNRKTSSNIVHVDRIDFKSYPPSSPTFWKRVFIDKAHHYSFLVNPLVEVNLDGYEIPQPPVDWAEAAKERGVKEPWRYKESNQ